MRLLITGSEGQVGSALFKSVSTGDDEVLALNRTQLDITDKYLVEQTVGAFLPDVIINAAAYTNVDKAETEKTTAFSVNKDSAACLAQAAAHYQAIFIHLSTDYVFSGQKKTPYLESDVPAPRNIYGASKLAGELEIARLCPQHVILRTSWVFGEYGHNFVKTMLRLAQSKTELSIVGDQTGAPTYAGDIALTLLRIAQFLFKEKNQSLWGSYHYCGTPDTTWAGFAHFIFDLAYEQQLLRQKPLINIISSSDYPAAAIRPMNSRLDCTKIARHFDIPLSDWKLALKHSLACYL